MARMRLSNNGELLEDLTGSDSTTTESSSSTGGSTTTEVSTEAALQLGGERIRFGDVEIRKQDLVILLLTVQILLSTGVLLND